MSLTKRLLDELNREEEPRYGDEVETWPSDQELADDSEVE
jgi:hypothetical protein